MKNMLQKFFGTETSTVSEPDKPAVSSPNSSGTRYSDGDGVTHINIWSRGQTRLGQELSHFSYKPFIHPFFGPFNSMEGFWYYLKSADKPDKLRRLWGFRAKEVGRELENVHVHGFSDIIIAANWYKIEQDFELRQMVEESTLPFDHYYLFGEDEDHQVLIRPKGHEWLVQGFEQIRTSIKNGEEAPTLDYDKYYRQFENSIAR
jgi:hypothetical protein